MAGSGHWRCSGLDWDLAAALREGGVQLVVVPVDYAENIRVLVDALGGHVPEIA